MDHSAVFVISCASIRALMRFPLLAVVVLICTVTANINLSLNAVFWNFVVIE